MPRLIRCETQLEPEWRELGYAEIDLMRPTRYPHATLQNLVFEGTRVIHYWYAEDDE